MNKLKEIWGYIAAGIVAIVGILVYIITRKGEEINALKAKIDMSETQKEADVIETEIKQAKARKDNLTKQNQELDKSLEQLKEKRKEIKKNVESLTDPEDIANYWDNN